MKCKPCKPGLDCPEPLVFAYSDPNSNHHNKQSVNEFKHAYSTHDKCGKGSFKCKKSGKCVPDTKLMDGIQDCPDKEDEGYLYLTKVFQKLE